MIEYILPVLKIIGTLILLLVGRGFQVHFRERAKLTRLQAMGIESYPGNEIPLIGANAKQL